jgi:signal peptidase II
MRSRWLLFTVVVALGVALDGASKEWALRALVPGRTQSSLGGLVPLTLSFNRGVAFGLHVGPASRSVFTVVAVAVLAAAISVYRTTPLPRRLRRLALALMCAGALGNLVDRVVRAQGVVDFIGPYDLRFMVWPIFNLADVFVVLGTLGFAATLFRITPWASAPRGH